MTDVTKRFTIFKHVDDELEEQNTLLDSLYETHQRLSTAWNFFQNTSDPDLIESCIYEINAISAQYSHLLRRARKIGAENKNYLRPRNFSCVR